jgi:hypothetical protein
MKKCQCNQMISALIQILGTQSDYIMCITMENCVYGFSAYVASSSNVVFLYCHL